MKIIQILNHFLPSQTAGTEVYVWALSKHLQQLNFEVSVLIPNYGKQLNDIYDYDGLTVVKYAEPSLPDRALILGQKFPEGLKNFTRYLQEQRPDIVHFHEVAGSNGIGLAHFEAAKEIGAKVIFTLHLADNTCSTGTLMYKGAELCDGIIREIRCSRCVLVKRTENTIEAELVLIPARLLFTAGINTISWQNPLGTAFSTPFQIKKIRNKLERITKVCDKIIPITDWYYKILLLNNVAPAKMKVILQALPTEATYVTPQKTETALPLRFIFIGRLSKIKGIHLLIEAVKKFSREQIQLDIYGSPADEQFVQECKAASASFTFIRWMGKVAQNEVVTTISKYHALVLPSIFSEMSPLVIQEAFAAGVPVIGSNVYGIAEQIKHGINGWLFPFGDKEALQKQLQILVDNPALINTAKKQLPKTRSFKEVAIEYDALYKEIVD
jgi:glycosyltransferase involved in cell wall biosynthesis